MPTLAPGSTVSFPLQVDQVLTLTNNFSTGNVVLSAQKSGDVVFSYTNEQMQDAPVFSQGSQGIVTINNATGFLTYNVTSSAFPLFENTPRTIFQSAIPFIFTSGTAGASTNQFTMGNNGALSTLPTLLTTYGSGAFIYMPANAIFTGSTAGWYWFVPSSTTAGTVYNNRYISGDPKLAVPTTLVSFVSTGPGLVTTTNNTTVTAATFTVPGGLMGPNGQLAITYSGSLTNNANFKSPEIQFGGFSVQTGGMNNSTAFSNFGFVANRNSQALNIFGRTSYFGSFGSGGAFNFRTVNTATAQDVSFLATLPSSSVGEFLIFEVCQIVAQYGA